MDDDVIIQFPLVKTQLIDVLKLYHNKTKEQVIATGSFKRDVLVDTVFALKDIAQKLVSIADTISQGNKFEKQMEKLVNETIPEVVRNAMKSATIAEGVDSPNHPNTNQEKHAVIVEPEDGNFNQETWAEAVKRMNTKLIDVPVKKNLVTKDGEGCILFPDKDSLDKAEAVLKDDYVVRTSSKLRSKLMPKLKIHDLEGFDNEDKSALRNAILQKNDLVRQLIYDDDKILDVLFIDAQKRFGIIKVSPEVRNVIMKVSAVYIGMRSHHVKDQYYLTQCFCCQQFGHKQGSEHCPLKGTTNNVCLYCGENHRSKDCPSKQDKTKHKCTNCSKSNNSAYQSQAHGHTSTSRECPVRINELKFTINRTDGMSFAKNFPRLV